ncbi:ribosome biogenesis GTP-binding protein YihA/YsxC [Spirochaetota bacterium]
MKIKKLKFLKSCTKVSDFPDYTYPEYAFLGRSNVGKSSLINMILGRKKLVKTGSKPGVTKMINFFLINDDTLIADMPGFGYAKLPAALRKTFMPLIKSYIKNRKNLKLAFLLIDIRRIPGDFEQQIISLLAENRIPTVITVTKCDKQSKNQKLMSSKKIGEFLNIDSESIFFTSSKTGEGKKELLKLIEEFKN